MQLQDSINSKQTLRSVGGRELTLTVNFGAKPGDLDTYGHRILTSQQEIDDFINLNILPVEENEEKSYS